MRDRIAGLFSRRHDDVEELIRTDNHETAVAHAPDTEAGEVTVAEETVAEATVEEETVADETVAKETVAESSVPDVADETVRETEETAEPTPGFDIVWLDTSVAEPPPGDIPAEPPAAVAPPEDFKFPWTRPDSETASEPEAFPTEPPREPELVEPTLDASAASEPETKKPGFFSRLFRKTPKQAAGEPEATEAVLELQPEDIVAIRGEAIVVEALRSEPTFVENPAVVEEGPFTSVEDALPASEEASVTDEMAIAAEEEAPPPPKRGFFSRLFGRGATEEPPRRLSVEVYQDRIEAAANALDVTGENAFTPGEDTLPETDDAFASVEEALPTDADRFGYRFEPIEVVVPVARRFMPVEESLEESLEEPLEEPFAERLPSIEDLAPEVTVPSAPAPPVPPLEESVEVLVEEPVAEQVEVPVAEQVEVPVEEPVAEPVEEPVEEPVATAEQDVAPIEAATSRDTLELERATDEFEIILPPPEEPAVEEVEAEGITPAPGDETVSLEKKSIWSRSFVGRLFRRGDTEVEEVGAAAAAAAAEGSSVFLLAKFRAFYNEIIRFKHQKSEFTAGFATAIVAEYSADISPDAAAEGLSKRLTELLELQAAEAKWMGGEAGDRYPDAQYAMAALADETFTQLEWEGQAVFPKYSIEKKLYQTNAADVDVFRRMDKLLKDSPDSVVARDLARVYLLVIAAGFRGKYRPFGLTRALAEYRHRLYEYIHNGDALMLYAPERTIFPEAVSQTLAGQALRRFSAAQRWAAILLFLVVSYTLIAHFAWNRVAADLKDVTARIKSGSTAGAR